MILAERNERVGLFRFKNNYKNKTFKYLAEKTFLKGGGPELFQNFKKDFILSR
jgi:hypothetical protein